MRRTGLLSLLMVLGLAAGAFYGQSVLFDPTMPLDERHWTRTLGDYVLIRPMLLLLMPVAFVALVVGVASVGNRLRLGLMIASTLVFFLASTSLAVGMGLFLAVRFAPGSLPVAEREAMIAAAPGRLDVAEGVAEQITLAREQGRGSPGGAWMQIVDQIAPVSIAEEISRGRLLGVILLATLLGIALAAGGEKTAAALAAFRALHEGLMIVTGWLAWLSPLGLMAITAHVVGRIGLESLRGPLSRFMLVVLAGLALHALVVLPIIMLAMTRRSPWSFLLRVHRPLLLGFGTASSAVAMPLAVQSARDDGRCSIGAAGFVLPLGTAVHRCGTALFQAVAAVFLFQLHGIDLAFGDLVIVAVTATLASIVATGIPGAGLVTLAIVIESVNTSLVGRGMPSVPVQTIGVIVAVDRVLDMARAAVNVWGNMVGARIMTAVAPDAGDVAARERNRVKSAETVGR